MSNKLLITEDLSCLISSEINHFSPSLKLCLLFQCFPNCSFLFSVYFSTFIRRKRKACWSCHWDCVIFTNQCREKWKFSCVKIILSKRSVFLFVQVYFCVFQECLQFFFWYRFVILLLSFWSLVAIVNGIYLPLYPLTNNFTFCTVFIKFRYQCYTCFIHSILKSSFIF